MILISACLAGINCKYNAGNNTVEELLQMYLEGKCTAVCPEQLGGLSTPRPSAEIIEGRVINTEGADVTLAYQRGSQKALQLALDAGCTEAVLKACSPSCGVGEIYDGTFTHTRIQGNGIFADMCIQHGIHCMSEIEYKEKKR